MMVILQFALFGAAFAAVIGVFLATMLPAMPRIIGLLSEGAHGGSQPMPSANRLPARRVPAMAARSVALRIEVVPVRAAA